MRGDRRGTAETAGGETRSAESPRLVGDFPAAILRAMNTDILTRLRRRARRLAPSATEAEDLVQEALLGYLEQCARGALIAGPLPYMMTALRHAASARSRHAARALPIEAAPEPLAGDGELACYMREVLDAIDALPPGDRDLLRRVVAGETRPSILARQMGVPTGTAMSRLARARNRLRETLQHESADT